MIVDRLPVWLVVTAAIAVALSGCARRPALIQAAAPAPSGAATTGTESAPPIASGSSQESSSSTDAHAPSAAPTVVAPADRPQPKDFAPMADLKSIHFDFDKYDIRDQDARVLDVNAEWLKSHSDHLLLIEGHCDERGTNEYNQVLGERRAKAAMNYLVSRGIAANRITMISYGEERPLCTEHTESCWEQNRRAEFLVKPQ